MSAASLYGRSHWAARAKALRNVPLVLRLMWEAAPALFAASLTARMLVALVPLVTLAVSKAIVDALVLANANGWQSPRHVLLLVGLEFLVAAIGAFLIRFVAYCDTLCSERFTLYVSVKVMSHASKLDLASYEDPVFYDKLERARVQATDRFVMIKAVGDLIQNATLALSLAVGLASHSVGYVLVLFLCTLPVFFADSYFSLKWYSLKLSQTPLKRELDYLRYLGASRDSAKELRLFDLGGYLVQRYAAKSAQILRDDKRLQGQKLAASTAAMLTTVGQYAVYAFVASQAFRGEISVGTLLFLVGAVAGAARAIQEIFVAFSSVADQGLFVTDLREFLAVQPQIVSPPHARKVPQPIARGFELRNVSFCYPGTSRRVLDDVSFTIGRGQRVALVGENGEGKTTLVKLLLRLYDPTQGQILLDGIDLREYSIEDLHACVGVIFQDFVRYEMTAAENIAIAAPEKTCARAMLDRAAKWSGADEIIGRLPLGFEQLLGRRFYGGIELSGGEWQRVALARAYVRRAQLFILDEPTAALDAKAEREVFDHFADLTADRMALFISHRFSTVRTANRILVLSRGRIIEDDDHLGLMARRGTYHRLFTLQAQSYT